MKRITIPGGWYCDTTPEGASVALITGSHLEHNGQRIELPHGVNVLQVDLSADGNRFCGIGHAAPLTDTAMEWDGFVWVNHGPTVGPRSVIFDAFGKVLTVPAIGHPAGALGYRQIGDDGRPVYSWQSHSDPVRAIWEYTTRGDLTVGQSGKGPHGEDAVIALYQGKRYVLGEGQCRFIKCRRSGDRLSLAWVQEDAGACVLLWLTLADLVTFPTQRFADVPAPPTPEPPKKPEEPVLNIQSAIELIGVTAREVDRQYPGLRSSDLERYTARVASACFGIDPRIGRKRADPGRPISKSALGVRHDVSREGMTLLTAVDFVRDESDADESEWGEPGNRNHIRSQPFIDEGVTQFWIKPEPLASEPKPEPTPEPTPEPVPPAVCTCAAELAALRVGVAEAEKDIAFLMHLTGRLSDQIAALEARPSGGSVPTKLRITGLSVDVEAVPE